MTEKPKGNPLADKIAADAKAKAAEKAAAEAFAKASDVHQNAGANVVTGTIDFDTHKTLLSRHEELEAAVQNLRAEVEARGKELEDERARHAETRNELNKADESKEALIQKITELQDIIDKRGTAQELTGSEKPTDVGNFRVAPDSSEGAKKISNMLKTYPRDTPDEHILFGYGSYRITFADMRQAFGL